MVCIMRNYSNIQVHEVEVDDDGKYVLENYVRQNESLRNLCDIPPMSLWALIMYLLKASLWGIFGIIIWKRELAAFFALSGDALIGQQLNIPNPGAVDSFSFSKDREPFDSPP